MEVRAVEQAPRTSDVPAPDVAVGTVTHRPEAVLWISSAMAPAVTSFQCCEAALAHFVTVIAESAVVPPSVRQLLDCTTIWAFAARHSRSGHSEPRTISPTEVMVTDRNTIVDAGSA